MGVVEAEVEPSSGVFEEEEEFNFKVNFSFLGAEEEEAAAAATVESFLVI